MTFPIRSGPRHEPCSRERTRELTGDLTARVGTAGFVRSGAVVCTWRAMVYYRQCLLATGILAAAITVRTGAISFAPAGNCAGARRHARVPGPDPQPAPAQTPAAPQPPAGAHVIVAAQAGGYVGTEKCLECHSEKGEPLKATAHGQVKNPRSPAATHGCESCHGPGQAHVEDDASGHMPKIKEMKPAEANQICLACHNRADHVGWEGSAHERAESHLHHLPQRPQSEVSRAAAGEGDAARTLRHMPSDAGGQDGARRRAHAGARRQDVLLVVSQPAWLDQQRQDC